MDSSEKKTQADQSLSLPAKAEKISAPSPHDQKDEEPEEFEEYNENESFMENLLGMFRSARMGRSIFGCLFVLLLVGGIVFLVFFGGWSRMRPYIPFLSPTVTAPTFSPDKIHLNVYDTRTAFHFGFYKNNPRNIDPPSLEIAYIFGGIKRSLFFPIPPNQSGINASYVNGFRGQSSQRFQLYVSNILQIQNILNTNVAALLDAQKNREPVLNNLIQSFDNLVKTSSENAALVSKEIVTMRDADNVLRAKLVAQEKLFTTSLSQFLPQDSEKQLNEYIKIAKEESEVKAQLGAMAKIDKYYQVGMVKLLARIRDIKANQDALLKGVKIFDIKNSDLNIIEYEGKPPADPTINAIDRSKIGGSSGGVSTPLNMFPQ